ncbi:MAG TPA: nuclear transport factor 2 family protein [Lysobacter sp.]|nr:nuclear transport factor 2 family protein [Lysobacter sp.]
MSSLQDFTQFMAERKIASDAFVAGDPSPLEKISANQEPATIFGPKGDCVRGAREVVAANRLGAGNFLPGGKNAFEVLHMAADGDLAYWIGIQRSTVKLRGQGSELPMDLRVTEIFRREDGMWKLMHRHADKLAVP